MNPRAQHPNNMRGFTLIELLLGTVLLSVILTMMVGILRTGILTWVRGESINSTTDQRFTVENFIRNHLHTMVMAPGPVVQGVVQGGLHGISNRLSYVAPMPEQINKPGLYRFELFLSDHVNGTNLKARIRSYDSSLISTESVIDEVNVVENIEKFEIAYLPQRTSTASSIVNSQINSNMTAPDWSDSWDESTPPALIRFRIKVMSQREWPELIVSLKSLRNP